MQGAHPPELIKLLAHDLRWGLFKGLTMGDFQVNELVTQLEQPPNLISYHLKKMRDDALVTTRRSEADGRDIYYSLDLNRLRRMYLEAGLALHPAIGWNSPTLDVSRLQHQRVLFVCTHNSARSQMAEGLLRHLSQGYLDVLSAGSHPTGIHPDAIRTMDSFGIDIRAQQSRSLSDIEGQLFNYVITVCDKAREVCPAFPKSGAPIHWSFADPAAIQDDTERSGVFEQTAQQLKTRIEYFLSTLPQVFVESGV